MRIEDVFAQIVELEERAIATDLTWSSINTWPLMRYCVWVALMSEDAVTPSPEQQATPTLLNKIGDKFICLVPILEKLRALGRILRLSLADIKIPNASHADIMFISRPVYLQNLPNGKFFDRVVDPLISVLGKGWKFEKLYTTMFGNRGVLQFPANVIHARKVRAPQIPKAHQIALEQLADLTGLDAPNFQTRYVQALHQFSTWLHRGEQLFAHRSAIKKVYVTSWYFPDMMGLIAAARLKGIRVIDVQHGKQGRYQGMYSGWTKIPFDGYTMMPNEFWCWGTPSCGHILASSPKRQTHKPFVGGFPWIEYYKRNVVSSIQANQIGLTAETRLCVLITTQALIPVNPEPVPDFIVEYVRSAPRDVYFIFRCHPNDAPCSEYIKKRLAGVSPACYQIDQGNGNLYDQFLISTHHITAFSSCCYEATAFGIPTLLFGEAASKIYADEITSGEFSWTKGDVNELKTWLEMDTQRLKDDITNHVYIQSSLELAKKLVNHIS